MSDSKKCGVIERTEDWPYVRKCKEPAEFFIDDYYAAIRYDADYLCEMHAYDLQQADHEVSLKKLKK